MSRYFGTDGIRGRAGTLLAPELAMRTGYGLAMELAPAAKRYARGKRPQVVVGHDTRLSADMLRLGLESGLALGGVDSLDIGLVPTPVVPQVVMQRKALAGVMITASHNPVADNGIKIFGPDGLKLNSATELAIEGWIDRSGRIGVEDQQFFGSLSEEDASAFYLSLLKKAIRRRGNGHVLRVVLDCANGATSELAGRAFTEAGHEVSVICDELDGAKVNVKCGATDLGKLRRAVKASGAELGLAFDGDGDRVLAVDELGRPVSGDRIIALFATRLPRYRQQGGVVMTHMTNMGVEQALAHRGVKMLRTDVGDINVMNAMIVNGINLGGEQSGHIIMRDKAPSGDGILVGLQLAAVLAGSSEPLSAMVSEFVEFPQLLTNLQVKDKKAWVNDRKVNKALDQVRSSFGNVRFYLRPSGTENVVRVLTESEDRKHCEDGNRAACAVFNDWSSRVS
ncbi:MAG: phosphoglucosamine mutase [Planctomycetales bacterium]|nr:phosphoglucosamine mutase [bacterium]UNM07907.1 MAG: phosphoglucosamine mutase [Planctomycetales bacterium]